MTKLILTETITPEKRPLINEAAGDGKFVYLKGLFLEGETKNRNGRVYPKSEIERAVKQLTETINKYGPIVGELDHPDGLNINSDRISHVITSISMDGNNGVGTMKVINAGMGLIVRGCVEAGAQLGVSSRGSGEVDYNGNVSDFDIVTIDIVSNPSAPHAYPKASLAESFQNSKEGREALKLSHYVKHDPAAQKHFQKSFEKVLRDIQDNLTWRK